MLSATFISRQVSVFQSHFISDIHSPKSSTQRSHFHSGKFTNPHILSCFSSEFPLHSDHSRYISISGESPDDKTDELSCSSCCSVKNSNLLALGLQSSSTLKQVKVLHAIVTRSVDVSATYVYNNLICAYVKFGELIDARKVFDQISERNVVSWTAILNGYMIFGIDSEALRLLIDLFKSGIRPNAKTYVCILNLCSRRLDLELGKQIHACIIKGNFSNLFLDTAAVYLYAQCGDLGGAFGVFERMSVHDVVSWTTMISACSQHGSGAEAFDVFSQMIYEGFTPNEFTLCSVLKACGDEKALRFGRQLHGAVVKKICRNDVFLASSLVDMYAKCGEIVDSRTIFDRMTRRNMVTWTSIIAGYAQNGLGEEAINLFHIMRRRKISANKLTIVSILKACGEVMDLATGKEMHAQIIKNCIHTNIYLGSTLVWLYCKCGEHATAYRVLDSMPLKDVVSWTAMISGCVQLGHELEALEFLKEMLGEGVKPNTFTYSSALKACAKLENIWQGKSIHSSVHKSPSLSNVFVGSSLINMYAKCGNVSEATRIFYNMTERNVVSWKAMILCYAKNGLWGEALKLLYQMQAESIEVDDYVLSTVLTTCGGFGWTSEPICADFALRKPHGLLRT